MDVVPSQRRLIRRSRGDRVLGGVCAGLATYFDVDPLLIRIVFIVLALAQGAGVVLYLLLWLVVPEEGAQPEATAAGAVRTGVAGIQADVRRITSGSAEAAAPGRQRAWLGGLLIAAGAYLLAANLGFFRWWDWRYAGPVLLILAGVVLLVRRVR